MKRLHILLLCLAALLQPASAQDLAPVPPLKARVTDLAGMLKPEQVRSCVADALVDTGDLAAHELQQRRQVIPHVEQVGPGDARDSVDLEDHRAPGFLPGRAGQGA